MDITNASNISLELVISLITMTVAGIFAFASTRSQTKTNAERIEAVKELMRESILRLEISTKEDISHIESQNLNSRVTVLENSIPRIENDIGEIKKDLKTLLNKR